MTFSLILISVFTFVELNCENLFDCEHDSLKNDTEFLPTSNYHWTHTRYWRKVNRIGQEIAACGEDTAHFTMPDMVALCEVENDSVMRDLTKRSLLRAARYEYLMTNSPDERGIDVALLYSPFSFLPINHHSIRITPIKDMRPTRDILYVSGQMVNGDTLHVFVVHAPSRAGGESASRSHRMLVADKLCEAIDSVRLISADAKILIAGDFNDYASDKPLLQLYGHDMTNVSKDAHGSNGSKGTYRFQGEWGSLDQIICSSCLLSALRDCRIGDYRFLLEEDETYGGLKPKRTYYGPRYNNGYSDHLPLVARFAF
jgi:endonuclease/exonuclease/phosphatase family metal-dependent hydrolase